MSDTPVEGEGLAPAAPNGDPATAPTPPETPPATPSATPPGWVPPRPPGAMGPPFHPGPPHAPGPGFAPGPPVPGTYRPPVYGQAPYGQPAYGTPGGGSPDAPAPGGPPPVPYGYGYAGGPVGAPRTDGLAIASLITSIVGVVLLCACVGLAGTVAGAIMGVMSRRRIRESAGMLTGDGLALGGIIVGAIGTVLGLGYILLFFASSR